MQCRNSSGPHNGAGTRAGDLLSNQYRPEIIGQWNRYIRDPEAFMRAVYPQDNKVSNEAAVSHNPGIAAKPYEATPTE